MLKKKISISFVILLFIYFVLFAMPRGKELVVIDVISPSTLVLSNGTTFLINDIATFDSRFTERNKEIAKHLGISEEEAFVLGNLARYKTLNILKDRKVFVKNNSDLIYHRYSYKQKFSYSGYCLRNNQPLYKSLFFKRLGEIRRAKYKVLDLENNKIYELGDPKVRSLKDFLLLRKSHIKYLIQDSQENSIARVLDLGNIKVITSDLTNKLIPDRNCNGNICKEILDNINNANSSIDIAIYGYSRVPSIEKALEVAKNRGVKIRLVYDRDSYGKNIYPDTDKLIKILPNSQNDGVSNESKNIMHNKFYIFDKKILITGSANLSHTDMSEFNANSIVKVNSFEVAEIYTREFEQMYDGKFHNEKLPQKMNPIKIDDTELSIYFSPQNKALTNAVIPLIKNAKSYIYIPTFVLTDKNVTAELADAKNRGVDVKIIMDALNASIKHSKHNELRKYGIAVKTENYAGKMHSKSMIIDDKYTIIGSMNFSNSGENKNDENLMVIKNPKITKFYKEFFLYLWNRIDNKWLNNNVRAESKDSIGSCYDGIDNNYDGLVDLEDVGCKTPHPSPLL